MSKRDWKFLLPAIATCLIILVALYFILGPAYLTAIYIFGVLLGNVLGYVAARLASKHWS